MRRMMIRIMWTAANVSVACRTAIGNAPKVEVEEAVVVAVVAFETNDLEAAAAEVWIICKWHCQRVLVGVNLLKVLDKSILALTRFSRQSSRRRKR